MTPAPFDIAAACREDDRRESAKCAAYEAQHGIAWADDADDADDEPAPFVDRPFLRGWLYGFGTAAMIGLVVALLVGEWLLRAGGAN